MFSTSELTLRFYLDALRQRWWLIPLVTVVAVAIGVTPKVLEDPVYASAVTIRIHAPEVSPPPTGEVEAGQAGADAGSSAQVLEVLTELEVLESAGMRADVVDSLGPDAAAFDTVTVAVEGFSSLLTVRITAPTPEAATAAAGAYADVYLAQRAKDVIEPLRAQAADLRAERAALLDELVTVDTRLADPSTEPFLLDTLRLERAGLDHEIRSLDRRADTLEIEADRREVQTKVVSEASYSEAPLPRGRARAAILSLLVGLGGGVVTALGWGLARATPRDAS